ncbi:MAG: DUF2807 domain-containing protein [Flavobacteriaceae bacterium]|nr:DUF2807 domain-containing protein [Flavobacteriaceae bacterium]
MKNWICIVLVVLSCDKENGWDCIQKSGTIIERTFSVEPFEKILVDRDVELILKEGSDFNVLIQTGENLIGDIEVNVIENRLELSDNNTCNYFRDYGITKIYVTAPNITEIRNSSQFEVSSDGVLTYPELRLLSEDFTESDAFAVGDFRLEVNTDQLQITSNSISSYYITGKANNLNISFFSGGGRFEGAHLIAQDVNVFHRGSNDMIVNPQQSLYGKMTGTGDVIVVNTPPTVDVEVLYIGSVVFLD